MPAEGEEQIIVIDDLYLFNSPELREELYPVLELLMERKEVWLILISRGAVPRWLMSLYVNYLFCVIGEKDLLLEREEQDAFFESWDVYPGERLSERIWRETAIPCLLGSWRWSFCGAVWEAESRMWAVRK